MCGARAGIELARLAAGDFEGVAVDGEIKYGGFGCAAQSKKGNRGKSLDYWGGSARCGAREGWCSRVSTNTDFS
jgi:hypothetical protein